LQDAALPAAEAAMDAARSFFRQPDSAKLAVLNSPEVQYQVRDPRDGRVHPVPGSGNGYRPAGGDIYFAKDQRESINFGREPLEPGEDAPYGNLWPAERRAGGGGGTDDLAPDGVLLPAGWRSTVLTHQEQMLQLSARLRRLVALALGAPESAFEEFFDRPTFQTGMVYYHAVVSDPVPTYIPISHATNKPKRNHSSRSLAVSLADIPLFLGWCKRCATLPRNCLSLRVCAGAGRVQH
jgi:isopenicillin N synthase-like dioxygenase